MWIVATVISLATATVLSLPTNRSGYNSTSNSTELFPNIVDVSHASPAAAKFFHGYFTAKSLHDADAWLSYFDPGHVFYYDAAVGGGAANWSSWVAAAHYYTSIWGAEGRSYPVQILGDTIHGALVHYTDTRPLFGSELRILAAVDFRSGLVTRQIDYWDGRGTSFIESRVPDSQYDQGLGLNTVEETAEECMVDIATKLQGYLSNGDADSAAKMFSVDGILEDNTLRVRQEGRVNILPYLQRVIRLVPYGPGSSLQHILGTCLGGGYEWSSTVKSGFDVLNGITALELDAHHNITLLTTTWESSRVSNATMSALASLAVTV